MVVGTGLAALGALVALAAGAAAGALFVLRGARGKAHPLVPPASSRGDTAHSNDDAAVSAARAAFDDALGVAIQRADRHGGAVCVLCVGIDNFQLLNDTYGHEVGDGVLRVIGERIAAAGDGRCPMVRLGGTEFLIATDGDLEAGRALASLLLAELSRAIDLKDNITQVACSVGIACYPKHGARPLLVNLAVMAMRAAREGGGSAHAEYQPQMGDDQREHAELARDLRTAVERGQLLLYYQPKVDAVSLQITAAEALLRWQHPTRGIVSPTIFIPIAERHGLIGVIGNWVLEEAARQAALWRDKGLRMRVAINVSGYQMRQDDFIDRLDQALSAYRLVPGRFTCEITETVAMEDTRVTQRAFQRLGQLGVHVSIDDFGTGHSSLAVLRRLPAAELKIDRAFVTDLGTSADALAVAKAVVQLAHSLDLHVVAEGVETEEQRDLLLELGCDELQGFLFARPMTAAALELWALNEDDGGDDGSERLGFRESLFAETRTADLG